jgi:hypothetical protein
MKYFSPSTFVQLLASREMEKWPFSILKQSMETEF